MATIEIYSREVYVGPTRIANGAGAYMEHTYLIYTDDAGNKRILRGSACYLPESAP